MQKELIHLLNRQVKLQCTYPDSIQCTSSGHQRPTSDTPFQWRIAGGLFVARCDLLTDLPDGVLQTHSQ